MRGVVWIPKESKLKGMNNVRSLTFWCWMMIDVKENLMEIHPPSLFIIITRDMPQHAVGFTPKTAP